MVAVDTTSFVLADIPGLIEGAHEGVGLGIRFLGHIERCGSLLHLVDGTQDDVAEAYLTIRAELEAYGHGLGEKPEILALNKCDALLEEEADEKAAILAELSGKDVIRLSAASGQGVTDALRAMAAFVEVRNQAEAEDTAESGGWRPI